MFKPLHFLGIAALVASLAVSNAVAAPVTADFRSELDLPVLRAGEGPRVFESLGEAVDGAPDLDAADEIDNPGSYNGFASVDLDAGGLITLTGDLSEGAGDYELAIFTISNIVFSDGSVIAGVTELLDGVLGEFDEDGRIPPVVTFTGNSVTITYDHGQDGTTFNIADGGVSTFQINTRPGDGVVPLPAALPLLASGFVVMGAIGWRKQRSKR